MLELELKIMLFRFGAKFDFLHLDHGLLLFGLVLLFRGLIFKLTVVHDPANRRGGLAADLDQVEAFCLGCGAGCIAGHNAELLPFIVNDPDLACRDGEVDAGRIFGWRCWPGLTASSYGYAPSRVEF